MIICNLCRLRIYKGDCIYVTKCEHIFHSKCLKPIIDSIWFTYTCPGCNKKIKKGDTKLLMMPMDN